MLIITHERLQLKETIAFTKLRYKLLQFKIVSSVTRISKYVLSSMMTFQGRNMVQ
jgi:hypothetical protein